MASAKDSRSRLHCGPKAAASRAKMSRRVVVPKAPQRNARFGTHAHGGDRCGGDQCVTDNNTSSCTTENPTPCRAVSVAEATALVRTRRYPHSTRVSSHCCSTGSSGGENASPWDPVRIKKAPKGSWASGRTCTRVVPDHKVPRRGASATTLTPGTVLPNIA